MFGIGFWELAVIVVIGLVVFGPEDLVKHAKKGAYYLKRLRRVKDEVFDEIRDVTKHIPMDEFNDIKQQVTDPVQALSDSVAREMDDFKHTAIDLKHDIESVKAEVEDFECDGSGRWDTPAPEETSNEISEASEAIVPNPVAKTVNAATSQAGIASQKDPL